MLGVTPGMGKALGLDENWAYNAIKAVGNYGEIFDRHLGMGSPLKLERGHNNLWTKGGLVYAPPIRRVPGDGPIGADRMSSQAWPLSR